MRTKIANLLMLTRAETGITFYRMGQFGGITAPTMSRWFLFVGHERHRNPTEEQILEISISLAYDGYPPGWLRDLYEAGDSDFLHGLDRRRSRAGISWPDVAERSAIGVERLNDIVGGGVTIPCVVRSRLLIATLFTPTQGAVVNRILQAADRYVVRIPDTSVKRTA